jgi:hypothetical protein
VLDVLVSEAPFMIYDSNAEPSRGFEESGSEESDD